VKKVNGQDPAFHSVQERTLMFPQATGRVIPSEKSLESIGSFMFGRDVPTASSIAWTLVDFGKNRQHAGVSFATDAGVQVLLQ
jgi:hypothetical protein